MDRRWIALGIAGALAGAAGLAVLQFRAIVGWSMTPGEPFDAQTPPDAPDYADDAVWSALPGRADAGDALPTGVPGIDQASAPVDVFYVHPTSYVGSRWNGPVHDPTLNEATDRVATGIQATAFNGCCAVYAPRYRQANGTAFTAPTPDTEKALALAYDDVRRAFEAFQARRGPARPFVLAAHSQGSILAERLLYEETTGPLRDQLVFAVLPGGSVTDDSLREHDLRPCEGPDDLGCVVAWNARGPGYRPNVFALARRDPRPLLCINPLSWRHDEVAVPASDNHGAVFLEHPDPAPRPGFADARCSGETLLVTHLEPAPRDLPSRILDRALGPENYHPIEYQMYFMDLRRTADARARLYLESR